ncbi:MAG: hypothetical protein L6R40_007527 [Gallowayella cf. fulva]|nr:MAG: hypothetical protein L6R40_007527 [Xanthomendoza cf. fulva]
MQPGRVYIGRLPNHSGPVFVRKRRKSFANPFGVPSVTSIFARPQPQTVDYQYTSTAVYRPPPPVYMMPAPAQIVQPPHHNHSPRSIPALHVGSFDLPGTIIAIRWRQARPRVRLSAGNVSSSILQVKNPTRLNGHVGRRSSKKLAEEGVTDPTRPMSGAARLVRKIAESIIATGLGTMVEGNTDRLLQVPAQVPRSTSSDGLRNANGPKPDDDNNRRALRRMSALLAV